MRSSIKHMPSIFQRVNNNSNRVVLDNFNTTRNLMSFYKRSYTEETNTLKATTILSVRRNGKVVMIGDGQVSNGSTIFSPNAIKVRRLKGDVIVGFAGTAVGAITLLERMESKIDEYPGQLLRACVSLARDFARGKERQVDAVMLISDKKETFYISGGGDVHESPSHGVISIGSGSNYAASAALALLETDWDAVRIAQKVNSIYFLLKKVIFSPFNFFKKRL